MAPLASAAPPTARLMQRCGGGYRELPSSLFEELEQSHRTIDELRRQLEQALTAERSLVQQRSEKEGSAAHALVQAQLAFADKVALWNERLQEGAVQQQEATQLLAASQRQPQGIGRHRRPRLPLRCAQLGGSHVGRCLNTEVGTPDSCST